MGFLTMAAGARTAELKGTCIMTHLVVMEGDGIGPEITAATLGVLRVADKTFGLGIRFTAVPIGLEALRAQGSTLPDASYEAARAADGVILGPVDHNAYPPAAQGGINPSGELRKRLDSTPTSVRPGAAPAFRRDAAWPSIS